MVLSAPMVAALALIVRWRIFISLATALITERYIFPSVVNLWSHSGLCD